MRINKLVKLCMVLAVVAVMFGMCAPSSYSQQTSTGSDTAQASPIPLNTQCGVECNATKGYEIGGKIVLVQPGGTGTSGSNIALGYGALGSNTTGYQNTADGEGALGLNTTGTLNVASGYAALTNNTTGGGNTALGYAALFSNTTGSNNIAIGIGAGNNVSGGNSGNIDIGNYGFSGDNGVIRIGCSSNCDGEPQTSAYIVGISGVTLPTSNEPLVCIDPPTGQLGTLNCATNGASFSQQVVVKQQEQIKTLQEQNEEIQKRLSKLETLLARQ